MAQETSFSKRFGYAVEEPSISVREDAPEDLRYGLIMLGEDMDLSPHAARSIICGILLRRPDPGNWSAYPNVFGEVQELIANAPWFRVYDVAEGYYRHFADGDPDKAEKFQLRLNEFFREKGIGWEMRDGLIVARGSEVFTQSLSAATDAMKTSGRLTAANEMHEALRDLSRRPAPDTTGAIQHAMAALECVARDVTGSPSKTLGQIIPLLNLPPPLDGALDKLWGFASQQGRHLQEGHAPQFQDAELVVTIASAVSSYLLRMVEQTQGPEASV